MRNLDLQEIDSHLNHELPNPGKSLPTGIPHTRLVTLLYQGLLRLFQNRTEDVAVFSDLAWFPDPKNTSEWRSPDVYVVFGRPTRDRQSYTQWIEDNVSPQFVIEVGSESNSETEIEAKRVWYGEHGVKEFYWIEHETNQLRVFVPEGDEDELIEQENVSDWTSDLTQLRMTWDGEFFHAYLPNGEELIPMTEVANRAEKQAKKEANARKKAEKALKQTEKTLEQEAQARLQAEQTLKAETQARQQAEQAAEALRTKLRELGIDPDS